MYWVRPSGNQRALFGSVSGAIEGSQRELTSPFERTRRYKTEINICNSSSCKDLRVATVADVASDVNSVVATDGARSGSQRVSCTQHDTASLDHVLSCRSEPL